MNSTETKYNYLPFLGHERVCLYPQSTRWVEPDTFTLAGYLDERSHPGGDEQRPGHQTPKHVQVVMGPRQVTHPL